MCFEASSANSTPSLFLRHSDGVELTPIGTAITERAALILNQLEGLSQDAAAERGRTRGRLRLGVIPSVNTRLLPNILSSFSATSKAVEISVLEGSDAEVLEWLRTGAVDVATVTTEAHDLTTTLLARDCWMAVLPEDHRLTTRSSISIDELAREPFIMSDGGCEPAISTMAKRAGIELRSHYRVRDTNSLVAMVAEQLGITIMPELAVPAGTTRIRTVPLHPAEHRDVQLAVLSDAAPLRAATAFIAHAGATATILRTRDVRTEGAVRRTAPA